MLNDDSATQNGPANLAQLQATLNVIPAYAWYASPSGGLSFVNGRTADYLGLPLDHPLRLGVDLGAPWDAHIAFLHPDDHEETRRVWSKCLSNGEPGEVSFRVRSSQGDYRWFIGRAEPLRAIDGSLLQWVGVNVDIDEGKRAETELRAAQTQLARASQAATVAELSASIAHEINQPLAGIVASAQTCRTWLFEENPNLLGAKAAIERIIRDGNAAADIIRRIRALFKQTVPAKSPLNINAVIEEVSRLVQHELARGRVSLVLELAQNLPLVWVDRIQIQQVLLNLIRNGAEAMENTNKNSKCLTIRSYCSHENTVLEVCDLGPGLAHPEKAFEPFYSTKHDGLGVGLTISRSIVHAHGGVLRARDNQPRGTTFWLTLPLRSETPP